MKIQFVGPLFTSETSSFARVNKGLVLALKDIDGVELVAHQIKDRIDKWPNEEDFKNSPELKEIWQDSYSESDVTIYHDFPKGGFVEHDFKSLPGKIKLAYVFWEESVYPQMWVDEINTNLHGVLAGTTFVKEVLQNAGVSVPIKVISAGLNEKIYNLSSESYSLKTKKKFKFLHISTAKARKGVDVLLKAYFDEFSSKDDVCLVLKTSFSPDNRTDEILKSLEREDAPEVEHIQEILSDDDLYSLIQSTDAGVYPSRAEGFGLPLAEAMFIEKPVIATRYSGQLEFMDDDNSLLISYDLEKATTSEFGLIGSYWAEPRLQDLKSKMRYLFENAESEDVKAKIRKAKIGADSLTWENSADKTYSFIKQLGQVSDLKNEKLAVITPYNSQDGIADHSEFLYKHVSSSFNQTYYIANSDITDRTRKDDNNVVRLWETGESTFSETVNFIKDNNIKYTHIQYHSGFHYSVESLDELIRQLLNLNVNVFVTLHQIKGKGFNIINESKMLSSVAKVIIHNKREFEEFSSVLPNAVFTTLPRIKFKKRNKSELKEKLELEKYSPLVITHGLLTQKNNLTELLNGIALLKKEMPDIHLISANAVSANNSASGSESEKAKQEAARLGIEDSVTFIPDFLDTAQIEILLQAADIGVLNYTDVGESGSGAVGKFLAADTPVIVTKIPQFDEFKKEVLKIPDTKPESVSEAIKTLWQGGDLRKRIITSAREYVEQNSFEVKAFEHLVLYSNSSK